MKHFIFQIKRKRGTSSSGTVHLWAIKKNEPVYLGKYGFSFNSDSQAVVNAAIQLKAIEFNGCGAPSRHGLENSKVAKFHQL